MPCAHVWQGLLGYSLLLCDEQFMFEYEAGGFCKIGILVLINDGMYRDFSLFEGS